MTKIKNYNIDNDVSGTDKWVGTDNATKRTKNFTPDGVSEYLRKREKIDTGLSLRYTFDILEPLEDPQRGTLIFDPPIAGTSIDFSAITQVVVSRFTTGDNDAAAILQDMVNSIVLLKSEISLSKYGFYRLDAITPHPTYSNFYVADLTFLRGYGALNEDDNLNIHLLQDDDWIRNVVFYPDFASFPAEGVTGFLYVAEDVNLLYIWDGAAYQPAGFEDAPSDGQQYVRINGEWQVVSIPASSPTTTKGDVIVHNGSSDTRLPVGADGQTLLADSAEALGVKWGEIGAATFPTSIYAPTNGQSVTAQTEQTIQFTTTLLEESSITKNVNLFVAQETGRYSIDFVVNLNDTTDSIPRYGGIVYIYINGVKSTVWESRGGYMRGDPTSQHRESQIVFKAVLDLNAGDDFYFRIIRTSQDSGAAPNASIINSALVIQHQKALGATGPKGDKGDPGTSAFSPNETVDTGTVIDMGYIGTNYCNMASANTNLAYTLTNTSIVGGNVELRGNWASEPTITGATKVTGSLFKANVDMYLYLENEGNRIIYWFSDY